MSEQHPTPTTRADAPPSTSAHGSPVVHHADMPDEHPERHEHSDVSVRGIWITVGAIILTALVVHVLMYVVFFAYESAQAEVDEAERRSAITDVVAGPPREVPRLQGIQSYNADTPSVDQLKLEQENRQLLNRYATAPDGRVRIPINRAMDLALEKNLFPARRATTQPGGADVAN